MRGRWVSSWLGHVLTGWWCWVGSGHEYCSALELCPCVAGGLVAGWATCINRSAVRVWDWDGGVLELYPWVAGGAAAGWGTCINRLVVWGWGWDGGALELYTLCRRCGRGWRGM